MPSRNYYFQQAKLLLSWALATSDPKQAAALEAQARRLLVQAELPEERDNREINTSADALGPPPTRGPSPPR